MTLITPGCDDVGAGVAIDSIVDMALLFDQIPLDQMSVSDYEWGSAACVGLVYCSGRKQGVPPTNWQELTRMTC